MLEIDKLRLTDEEARNIYGAELYPQGVDGDFRLMKNTADAALAKALWGVQEWLAEAQNDEYSLDSVLANALEAAGVQRPKE